MKVLMLSKALVVASYRSKLVELAGRGVEMTAVTPESWKESGQHIRFESSANEAYSIIRTEMVWNGHFHLHYYPRLARIVDEVRPDLMHVDEEPYNLATYLAFRIAARRHIPALFFAWQNLRRRYPPPFRNFEQYVFGRASFGIAGTEEALTQIRARGYSGPAKVIPQFGVDTETFAPQARTEGPVTIGYLGRLVPEKGVEDLVAAFEGVKSPTRMLIAGDGPLLDQIQTRASEWIREGRVEMHPRLSSQEVPALLNEIDILVLPSRTTSRWVEQYGRILVEAMACGTTVVGSDSGEIPNVIGDAGRIFPEGDVAALGSVLEDLVTNPEERTALALRGRERVLNLYSQGAIAEQTKEVYRAMLATKVDS